MRHLLLTLGHNSSAILVEDGQVIAGYEEERLTGVKSDSRFPINAIKKLGNGFDAAYVTHWEPFADVNKLKHKYWQPEELLDVPVRSHTDNTHHDTHAYAALCFAGPTFPSINTFIVVVDGFGSHGEHFSLYKLNDQRKPELVFRARGYDTSLGLMYQYATAFLGMKMHEDEYKLLGYEVRIVPHHADQLTHIIDDTVGWWLTKISMPHLGSLFDPIYNLAALDACREHWFKHFSSVLEKLGITDSTGFEARTVIAHYVQYVLELCVTQIVKQFNVKHLIASGGCFYNVKLNRELINVVPGFFCAYPLAGDQGNALGLYYMDHPSFQFPDDLTWGRRELKNVGEVAGLEYIAPDQIVSKVLNQLEYCGYVNLVRGNMEFGPRALCNTSTLAVPGPEMVEIINAANNRNTVMPMAPVMLLDQYTNLFQKTDKVWKSYEYMIVALEYRESVVSAMRGAAHYYSYPWHNHWTGRPQVVKPWDLPMQSILHETGPLINTSFNYHGKPIAFDMPSIIENHLLQYLQNPNFKTLVVVEQ